MSEFRGNERKVQPRESIVESLENLKKELEKRDDAGRQVCPREIWFKINSCIYKKYPHF